MGVKQPLSQARTRVKWRPPKYKSRCGVERSPLCVRFWILIFYIFKRWYPKKMSKRFIRTDGNTYLNYLSVGRIRTLKNEKVNFMFLTYFGQCYAARGSSPHVSSHASMKWLPDTWWSLNDEIQPRHMSSNNAGSADRSRQVKRIRCLGLRHVYYATMKSIFQTRLALVKVSLRQCIDILKFAPEFPYLVPTITDTSLYYPKLAPTLR